MNFRTYDFLTQLIPGILLVSVVFGISSFNNYWQEVGAGIVAVGAILCFIVGYIINGVGHIIESLTMAGLNQKVRDFYSGNKIKGLYKLLKPFTKLRFIKKVKEGESVKDKFTNDFDKITPETHRRLDWLNQDKKFARSIIVTSLFLIIYLLLNGVNNNVEVYKFLIFSGITVLLFISFYKYFQSSVDYAYWVIKLSEKENKNA